MSPSIDHPTKSRTSAAVLLASALLLGSFELHSDHGAAGPTETPRHEAASALHACAPETPRHLEPAVPAKAPACPGCLSKLQSQGADLASQATAIELDTADSGPAANAALPPSSPLCEPVSRGPPGPG